MIKWEDSTPYRRGDEKKVPTCWETRIGGLRISVLNSHIHYPGVWVMHCYPWFDTYELNANTEEEAKSKAICIVYKKIKTIYNAFYEISSILPK